MNQLGPKGRGQRDGGLQVDPPSVAFECYLPAQIGSDRSNHGNITTLQRPYNALKATNASDEIARNGVLRRKLTSFIPKSRNLDSTL